MVECKDIVLSQNEQIILDSLSLSVKEKEKIVLLGINGSGKSTLLKFLNGLIFAQQGEYRFKRELITANFLKKKENFINFRKECSLLFQNIDAMLFSESVKKELLFSIELLGIQREEKEIDQVIKMLGLHDKLDSFPFMLSGGEKQKVALACVLLVNPEFLLLDEPLSSLDHGVSKKLIDYIQTLESTSIISTHSLVLAPELGERAIVLKEGKIIYDGGVNSFVNNHELLHKAGFLHTHDAQDLGIWHSHKK